MPNGPAASFIHASAEFNNSLFNAALKILAYPNLTNPQNSGSAWCPPFAPISVHACRLSSVETAGAFLGLSFSEY